MKLSGNTILITGGGTGIGLAIAEEFINLNNKVIICGRREEKLNEAKRRMPMLHTKVCDITQKSDREELYKWTTENFPALNVLVNNAGIQRETSFIDGTYNHEVVCKEIETNLTAPIHLCALFIPLLTKQKELSSIINITSGLAFTPLALTPVYSAAKAAMHSFCLTLRYQLSRTNIKVFELIPPIVDTELDHGARDKRYQADRGIKPREFVGPAMNALNKDIYEAAVGAASNLWLKREEAFPMLNRW
jgi:uncharacterized oxidoreductase